MTAVLRRNAPFLALFVLLTVVMTWPQSKYLATHSRDHQDVYFNVWRLAWLARTLPTAPTEIFDGNQFHPEPRALTFSDALLVEGAIGAPLFWLGAPRMLVHNLLLLGAMALSGFGAFVLARRLTGVASASVVAGIVFAFAPYRFEHYMHMEMQWAVWLPWVFWGVHRTVQSGALRDGLLTGVFVALQMASCMYYGVFLAALLPIVSLVLLASAPSAIRPRALRSLAAGGLLAVILCAAYVTPYLKSHKELGGRSEGEILVLSAKPRDYLTATPDNLLYGGHRGWNERRLFPGLVPIALALAGLLFRKPSWQSIAYVIGGVLAFEMSLGLRGHLYPLLYDHLSLFQGLRSPARIAIFLLLFLGVLASLGMAALASRATPGVRRALMLVVPAAVLLEYWVAPLALVPYPNTPPQLYSWLSMQSPGVVVEFPMPTATTLPGQEPRYLYMSTFHWMTLANGYSGYYPPTYFRRIDAMEAFPDDESVERLRRDNVRYILIHLSGYKPEAAAAIRSALEAMPVVVPRGRFDDGNGDALAYQLY